MPARPESIVPCATNRNGTMAVIVRMRNSFMLPPPSSRELVGVWS